MPRRWNIGRTTAAVDKVTTFYPYLRMMQASFSFNTTATLCPVYPKNAHHPFLDRAIAPVLASASEASNIGKRLAQWWEISSQLLRLLHQPFK